MRTFILCTLITIVIVAPAKMVAQSFASPLMLEVFSVDMLNDDFINQYVKRRSNQIEAELENNKEVVKFIEFVLSQNGIPADMKCLALIESSLKSNVISSAGAAGIWQLMPATAVQNGLQVSTLHDDRIDVYKSTHAAAQILKELYKKYNDWGLVVAAYDCGSPRLDKLLSKTNGKNCRDIMLLLPAETQRHLKKFAATCIVVKRKMYGNGSATMNKAKAKIKLEDSMFVEQIDTVIIESFVRLDVVARKINVPIGDLKKMNDHFEKIGKSESRVLRLPKEKVGLFIMNKVDIVKESIAENVNSGSQNNEGCTIKYQ